MHALKRTTKDKRAIFSILIFSPSLFLSLSFHSSVLSGGKNSREQEKEKRWKHYDEIELSLSFHFSRCIINERVYVTRSQCSALFTSHT